MLNFHLGVPGLVPDLFQSLEVCGPVRAAADLHLVPPQEYQALFFELVAARTETGPASFEAFSRIEEFIKLASSLGTVAVSQPSFFGYPADALRPRKSFPLAEARVGRLSGLIGSCEMTFHLLITSQIDYILQMRRMPETDRLNAIRDARFSWSELVFRIRRGAPERNLVVWDFDRPKAVALPFVESMLGIEALDLKEQITKAILPRTTLIGSGPINYSDPSLVAAVARLDDRYDLDLDEIERMEGVTLVRHDAIPPDFFL